MAINQKNLHVPLSENLYSRLRETADLTQRPATELAREAIQTWLEIKEREALREKIQEYAVKMAGTPDDLDPDLEEAAIEHLTSSRKRGRK